MKPLSILEWSGGGGINFPVARLGDIIIFFQHYSNFNEAKSKWDIRKLKIIPDAIYVIFNYISYDRYACHKEFDNILESFNALKYKNKIFLHSMPNFLNNNENIVYTPNLGLAPHMYFDNNPRNIQVYQVFNFAKWLNCTKKLEKKENKTQNLSKEVCILRIKKHLAYKLGTAMIKNSKSLIGYLKMPYILISTIKKHKQEQKAYEKACKENPSLKLPPLETYTDYNEALKIKEHLSYKLGEALIEASNNAWSGGYLKFLFIVVPRIVSKNAQKSKI